MSTTPDVPAAPTGLTRRRALCGIVVALAAPGVLAACSSGAEAPAPAGTGGQAPRRPAAPPPPRPRASRCRRSRSAAGRSSRGPNGPVVLTQPQAGVIKAFDATCPHQGTPVDAPEGGTITCPNHGSQFDAASGALKKGPAQSGLTPVATTVVGRPGAVRLIGGR